MPITGVGPVQYNDWEEEKGEAPTAETTNTRATGAIGEDSRLFEAYPDMKVGQSTYRVDQIEGGFSEEVGVWPYHLGQLTKGTVPILKTITLLTDPNNGDSCVGLEATYHNTYGTFSTNYKEVPDMEGETVDLEAESIYLKTIMTSRNSDEDDDTHMALRLLFSDDSTKLCGDYNRGEPSYQDLSAELDFTNPAVATFGM